MHAVVEEEPVRLATDDDHGPEVRPRHLRPHLCLRQRDPGPDSGGDRSRNVVHRGAAVELESGSLLRQPRSQLPEEQLRVDGRPVIPFRELGDERRRGTGDDTDAERNDAVRLRDQRPLDRLVDYRRGSKNVRGDKDPRRAQLELERRLESLLDRRHGRLRGQPADRHAADRHSVRNRRRRLCRSQSGREHTGDREAGQDGEKERNAFHAVNIVKIRGSFVMIPSTPSPTSLSASLGSSTVQT